MQIDTLGEKIRMYRNYKGYSQQGLADIAGISQSKLSFIEKNRNKKKCDAVMLKKICKALEISDDYLESFGEMQNDIYGSAVNDLNKKEKVLLDTVFKDEKGFGHTLSIFEVFTKIIGTYKIKLDECEERKNIKNAHKKIGGGKSESALLNELKNYFHTNISITFLPVKFLLNTHHC